MNIDICKKCLNCNEIKFYYYDVSAFGQELYFLKLCGFTAGFDEPNFCQIKGEAFENKDEIIKIIHSNKGKYHFQIDESCPYYVEHQISDFNK